MNTSRKGDIAEAKVLTKFLTLSWSVSIPFGDNDRYDLILDKGDGKLHRIQVKKGRLIDGAVVFNVYSNTGNGKARTYKGEVDYFAVTHKSSVYLVPIEETTATEMRLRVEPTKNRQVKNIRWAKDYEI
jgi:hypothetical protein